MIKPARLLLGSKARLEATVREDSPLPLEVTGTIHVECSSAQAFAEILNYLVHADEAIAAVQLAISTLQMAKGPAERLGDLRKLQNAHWRLTGWHFPSTALPALLDNCEKQAIIPAKGEPR